MLIKAATTPTRPQPTLKVRLMSETDVLFAVELHKQALHNGFFVQLGHRFLAAYYRSYLTSPGAVALIGELDGTTVGFLVGTVDRNLHYRHVLRSDRYTLGVRGLTSLVCRPRLAIQFLNTRLARYTRGVRRASKPSISTTNLTGCEGVLSHIAVCEMARGKGVGQALVSSFVEASHHLGSTKLSLVTLVGNEATQLFYTRMGWVAGATKVDVDGASWITFTRVFA